MNKTDSAPDLLDKAAKIMIERGKQYDKPQGERSMAATVAAFSAITGKSMTESHGWLLLAILKMVRDNQQQAAHRDSCEDLIAYASLYAESRLASNDVDKASAPVAAPLSKEKVAMRAILAIANGLSLDYLGTISNPRFAKETDDQYRQRLFFLLAK